MKVVVFSHESDLDGLYSASIALIRYPQATTFFLGYGVDNFQRMGDFIFSSIHSSMDQGLIIIADLGLSDDVIEICSGFFSDAVRNGWKIMWIDHHPWSQQATSAFAELGELVHDPSGRKCASDLIYEKLLPENELAGCLARMAHTMDFFTKDQYLTPISELIRYYQSFPDFYDRLSVLARKSATGILWDVEMQADYLEYVQLKDRARDEVFSTMQVRSVNGINVAYVQSSPYIQNSLFSEEVFAKTPVDVVMFYSNKGKVSIRRNNENISCREIAKNLPEGGGHDYAAGAKFKSNPEDIEAVINELQAALEKALSAGATVKK